MKIILWALILFIVFLVGLSLIAEKEEDLRKQAEEDRKWKIVREAVAPIHQTYQEMKRNDSCCRLFSQCKADIELYTSSLECVRIGCNTVEFSLFPKMETRQSWETPQSHVRKWQVQVKITDFLPNMLSPVGSAALAYWIVSDIPIMTYDGITKDISSLYYKEYFEFDGKGDICSYMEVLYPQRSRS